jgi:hypothetical protein
MTNFFPSIFGVIGAICASKTRLKIDFSLKYGFRLISSYQVTETEKLWVITEADRSVTTLLLPAEY